MQMFAKLAASNSHKLLFHSRHTMNLLCTFPDSLGNGWPSSFPTLLSANFSRQRLLSLRATALYNFIAYTLNPFAAVKSLTQRAAHYMRHVMTVAAHVLERERLNSVGNMQGGVLVSTAEIFCKFIFL